MTNIVRLGVVVLCVSIISIGCRKEPVVPAPKSGTPGEGPVLAPPQQTPQGGNAALPTEGDATGTAAAGDTSKPASENPAEAAKIKATLASLPAEERAAIEKQKICPVSGEKLGTMGAPPKVTVAGHTVYLCCKGCEEPLTKEPEKFLAKIGLEPNK
jgi:YHS domain-containing protein